MIDETFHCASGYRDDGFEVSKKGCRPDEMRFRAHSLGTVYLTIENQQRLYDILGDNLSKHYEAEQQD